MFILENELSFCVSVSVCHCLSVCVCLSVSPSLCLSLCVLLFARCLLSLPAVSIVCMCLTMHVFYSLSDSPSLFLPPIPRPPHLSFPSFLCIPSPHLSPTSRDFGSSLAVEVNISATPCYLSASPTLLMSMSFFSPFGVHLLHSPSPTFSFRCVLFFTTVISLSCYLFLALSLPSSCRSQKTFT